MDGSKAAGHFFAAATSGFMTSFAITAFILPASFVMNRFIYHHFIMRLMLGIIAGWFGLVSFLAIMVLVMSGKLSKSHYFGMFPVVDISIADVSGWVKLDTVLRALIQPISMVPDNIAYMNAVTPLLEKEGSKNVVNEELFKKARYIATLRADKPETEKEPADWSTYLREIASVVQTTVAAPTPV